MATADELIIKIRADMRDIERKLDGLERESGQTSRTMQQHFQRAAQGINNAFRNIRGPALAATAAGTAFAYMAQRSLEAVEAISDLSTRADVSAEFLQEMRFAINQSGGSARDFDDAISRLNRRFGLFLQNLRTGEGEAGPAAAAFRALGLETRIVNGELTDAEGVFNAAVQGLSEVESAAQRSALASQLFGEDSGPRLVALLDQGVEGIDALRQAARSAGVVLDNDLVASAARSSDALEIMRTQVGSEFNRAIAQNADGLISFARVLTDVATAAIRAAAAIGRMFDTTGERRAESLQRYADLIAGRTAGAIPGTITEAGAESVLRQALGGDPEAYREARAEVARIFDERVMIDDRTQLDYLGIRDLTQLFLGLASGAREASREAQALQAEINALNVAGPSGAGVSAGGGAGAGSAPSAQQGDAVGYFGGIIEMANGFMQQADALKAFEDAGMNAFENVTDAVDTLKIRLEGIADGAVKNLEDAFVDFVRTGRFEIASLVDYMIEQFARLAFQNTIGNALDSVFATIISAVVGGPAAAAASIASGVSGKVASAAAMPVAAAGITETVASAPALQVAAAGSQARSMTVASGRAVTVSQPITIDARGADAGVEDRIRRIFADQGPALQQQTIRATIEAIGRINGAGRVQN
jgi:hypothetical protein